MAVIWYKTLNWTKGILQISSSQLCWHEITTVFKVHVSPAFLLTLIFTLTSEKYCHKKSTCEISTPYITSYVKVMVNVIFEKRTSYLHFVTAERSRHKQCACEYKYPITLYSKVMGCDIYSMTDRWTDRQTPKFTKCVLCIVEDTKVPLFWRKKKLLGYPGFV